MESTSIISTHRIIQDLQLSGPTVFINKEGKSSYSDLSWKTLGKENQIFEQACGVKSIMEELSNGKRNTQKEFYILDEMSFTKNHRARQYITKESASMNRYSDMMPYVETQVLLSDTGRALSTYINADFIHSALGNDCKYIAA